MLPGLATPALLKIPLTQLTWDWTGAESLNIPDYLIVPILTQVLTGIFLLLLLYLSLTTDYRHTPTKTSFSAG
jgi:hypothetical protein